MARKVFYDEDAPKLTAAELAEMRPAQEVHTPEEYAALAAVRKRGRPKAEIRKVLVTMRLDPDVVEAFKTAGDGWQTRMNEVLRAGAPGLKMARTASAFRGLAPATSPTRSRPSQRAATAMPSEGRRRRGGPAKKA